MTERDTNLSIESTDSPELGRRNIWVTIMGVPGSGKSTLADVVSQRLGFVHVPELKVEDEELFTSYYENPAKYSLLMQSLFLFNKWQQTQGSKEVEVPGIRGLLQDTPVVSQPPIWQDGLFARARLKRTSEYIYYKGFYDGLVSTDGFPEPDLIVYMRISFGNMLARIKQRAEENPARAVELLEKPSYWKKLWKFHEVWVTKNWNNRKIAVIDADLFNFSRFEVEEEAKESLLKEFLHQVRYHLVGPIGEDPNPPEGLIIPRAIFNHRPDHTSHDITPGLATEQKVLQRT